LGSMDARRTVGLLLFLAGLEFSLGTMLAEFVYPGYSIALNYISDLGVWGQPSAIIFNPSAFIFGVLILFSAYILWKSEGGRYLPLFFALAGIGAMGVALFPETLPAPHAAFALMAFLFGNFAAILSYRTIEPPLSYLALALGVMGLAALVLFGSGTFLGIGPGGMERLIVYPVLFWAMGLGGYLMANSGRGS
jgi:hypothetical membrane protein